KDLFPVSRPAWVVRILAWDVLKEIYLASRDVRHRHVPRVSCFARFSDSVKRDASSIRRDRRKNSIGDLFLIGSVKISHVNGIIAFERDVLVARKRRVRKAGQCDDDRDCLSHGITRVMKKVEATAATRTSR